MNLPNKLTVLRMLLIPVFLVFYFLEMPVAALIVFAAASITDALDGHIARKHGLITDFGKLMDPLADKLLTMAAFVVLLQGNELYTIFLIAILAREFLVTAVRQVAASSGKILEADKWGKIKTILQMVWISYALLIRSIPMDFEYSVIGTVFLYVVVFVTVASGVNYCVKNRALFSDM